MQTEDIYEDMEEQKEHYDFSAHPKDYFLYSTENQALVGKVKDEANGKIITEFVGLRSKLYSLTIHGEKQEKKVAKGVKRCVIKKGLTFKDYKETLTNETQLERKNEFY